jgi:hypothetical protein
VAADQNRKGEQVRRYFRADNRCFRIDTAWYVATREGINIGPYPGRGAAEEAARQLTLHLGPVEDDATVRALIENFVPGDDPWPGNRPP